MSNGKQYTTTNNDTVNIAIYIKNVRYEKHVEKINTLSHGGKNIQNCYSPCARPFRKLWAFMTHPVK